MGRGGGHVDRVEKGRTWGGGMEGRKEGGAEEACGEKVKVAAKESNQ